MKLKLKMIGYPMILFLALAASSAYSQTFTVNCDSGDDLHSVFNGSTLGSDGQALQSNDTVNVSGTCYANGVEFVIPSSITGIKLNGVLGPSGQKPVLHGMDVSGTIRVNRVLTAVSIDINNLTVGYGGGGILILGGASAAKSTISNSSIINNTGGGTGRGIQVSSMTDLVNVTVTGNVFGVTTGFYPANISHSTIINNLLFGVNSVGSAAVQINYSILTGNGQADATTNSTGVITINRYNIFGSTTGNVVIDPSSFGLFPFTGLGTLADNGGLTPTIALLTENATNPAVNFIPLSECTTTTDQRGAPRPGVSGAANKSGCDAGAYETGDPKLVIAAGGSNPVLFPSVDVGEFSNAVVSVSNSGNSAAIGSGIYAISNAVFSVASPTNDLNIPINSSTALPQLAFTPTQAGVTSNGSLSISYNNTGASPLVVNLTGTANAAVPSPQMKDIIAYFAQGVKAKTIKGLGKNVLVAKLRLIAYGAGLAVTDQLIKKNKINDACLLLRTLIKTSDGAANPSDLIKGPGVAKLNEDLTDLRTYIGCAPITPMASDKVKDNDAGTVLSQ